MKVALTTGFARATQEAIVSALGWWSEIDGVLTGAGDRPALRAAGATHVIGSIGELPSLLKIE